MAHLVVVVHAAKSVDLGGTLDIAGLVAPDERSCGDVDTFRLECPLLIDKHVDSFDEGTDRRCDLLLHLATCDQEIQLPDVAPVETRSDSGGSRFVPSVDLLETQEGWIPRVSLH
jgi:hypothetical protein